MDLTIGEASPDFTLPDATGTEHSLSDFRGEWVLLFFYPRDNTPGCTREACALRDAYDEFRALGATVIGMSTDSERSHQRFIDKHKLPFLLLADVDHKVVHRYGSYGEKKFMGRVFDGVFRRSVLIDPDGKVARIYTKVRPDSHAAEVLADLRTLIAERA